MIPASLARPVPSWQQAVDAARRRRNLRYLRSVVVKTVLLFTAIGLLAFLVARWERMLAFGLAALGAMAALALHLSWLKRHWLSAQASPLWLDRQLGLKARLVTAHELTAQGIQPPLFDVLSQQLESVWSDRRAGPGSDRIRGPLDDRVLVGVIVALLIALLAAWKPGLLSTGPHAQPPVVPPPEPQVAQVPPQDQQNQQDQQDQQDQQSQQRQQNRQDQPNQDRSPSPSQDQQSSSPDPSSGHGSEQAGGGRAQPHDQGKPQRAKGSGKGQDQQEAGGGGGGSQDQPSDQRADGKSAGERAGGSKQEAKPSAGSASETQLKQEIQQMLQELEGTLSQMEKQEQANRRDASQAGQAGEPGEGSKQPGPSEGELAAQGLAGGAMTGAGAEVSAEQSQDSNVGTQPDPALLGEPEALKSAQAAQTIDVKLSSAPEASLSGKRPVTSSIPPQKGQVKLAKPTLKADPNAKLTAAQQDAAPVQAPYVPPEYQEILQRAEQ